MIACARCGEPNPDTARYCMNCGQGLSPPRSTVDSEPPRRSAAGFGVFGLSLAASLLLSFVLMYVLKLPVFLLFGFLPLLWWRRRD